MTARLWRRIRGPLAVAASVPAALALLAAMVCLGALGALALAAALSGAL